MQGGRGGAVLGKIGNGGGTVEGGRDVRSV